MKRWIGIFAGALLLVIVGLLAPSSRDWQISYIPATRALLAGANPFEIRTFVYAPWVLALLIPFAVLPGEMGAQIFFAFNFAAFAFVAWYWRAKPVALIAFLLSPPVVNAIYVASFEGLVLLGFCLPPALGVFLVLIKPQVGVGMVLYWLIATWRAGGWRETLKAFAPVTFAFGASLIFFGWWPGMWQGAPAVYGNTSLWPLTLPVGLALIVRVWQTREPRYAFPIAACLTPYLSFQSWVTVFLSLARNQAVMVATVAGLWIVVIIRLLSGS